MSAGECFFEVLELDGRCAVMEIGRDDDLLATDEYLVHEVFEELIAGLGRVDRGLGEALVERANGSFILKEGGFDVFCLDGLIEIAFLFFQCVRMASAVVSLKIPWDIALTKLASWISTSLRRVSRALRISFSWPCAFL